MGCFYLLSETAGPRCNANHQFGIVPYAGLQIRRSNRDNLGIIFNISSVKHIL